MPPAYVEPVSRLLDDLRRDFDDDTLRADTVAAWGLRPLTGARNNHVYAWTDPDAGEVCLKLYRVDECRRVEREWAALTLLIEHGIEEVPRPLHLFPSATRPAIAMTMVAGTPLPGAPDQAAALKDLAVLTRRIHGVPLAGVLAVHPRIDAIDHYIHRLTQVWPPQLAAAPDDPLTPRMWALLDRWHGDGDSSVLREGAPAVLSRADANLLDWLIASDGSAACVDFEYAGGGDAATDAADLTEHISARAVDDHLWEDLLPELGVTAANHQRFRAAQRTTALRWLAVLWKQRHHRSGSSPPRSNAWSCSRIAPAVATDGAQTGHAAPQEPCASGNAASSKARRTRAPTQQVGGSAVAGMPFGDRTVGVREYRQLMAGQRCFGEHVGGFVAHGSSQ